MIKYFSVVAMAALVMVGCNSGSKSSEPKAATLADAKKLAQNIGTGPEMGQNISSLGRKSTNNIGNLSSKSRSVVNQACQNGGSMAIDFDENQFAMGQVPTSMKMTMAMNQCAEEGEIVNGTIAFNMKNFSENMDTMDTEISFPTDFTVTAEGKTATIKKGGSMKMQTQAPYEVMTMNMTMTDGSETYGGKNLVYKMQDAGNSFEVFPVSGSENFGTGVWFTVDSHYDASQTPMVTDMNGDLQVGGLFKYLDGANHKVEVEATATNEVTVRVDENGNGSFEASEVEVVTAN